MDLGLTNMPASPHDGPMSRCLRPASVAALALLLPVLLGVPTAANSATVTQLWPEIDVYYRLNQDARLFFLVAPVREVNNGQRSEIDDTQFGAHIEVGLFPITHARQAKARYDHDRMKYLRFRTGVRYLHYDGDSEKDEWRIIAELTPRAHLPMEMHLVFRNRLDLRWIDDVYSWRYRPRLWLEREFKVGDHMALVPFVSAELYWDSRSDTWNRTRYQLGTIVSVTKWFAPEVYWAHQLDDASDGETVTNALGIDAVFFF